MCGRSRCVTVNGSRTHGITEESFTERIHVTGPVCGSTRTSTNTFFGGLHVSAPAVALAHRPKTTLLNELDGNGHRFMLVAQRRIIAATSAKDSVFSFRGDRSPLCTDRLFSLLPYSLLASPSASARALASARNRSCFSFLRRLSSPGGQRWQKGQFAAFMQPRGSLCKKAHGLHFPFW